MHCTIPGRVGNLLQVQEVRGQDDVSHFRIIQDLNSDPLSQRRKLLDEGDLLIPNRSAAGSDNRRLPLGFHEIPKIQARLAFHDQIKP